MEKRQGFLIVARTIAPCLRTYADLLNVAVRVEIAFWSIKCTYAQTFLKGAREKVQALSTKRVLANGELDAYACVGKSRYLHE